VSKNISNEIFQFVLYFLKYFNGQNNQKKTKEYQIVFNFFLFYCKLLLFKFFFLVLFTFAALTG